MAGASDAAAHGAVSQPCADAVEAGHGSLASAKRPRGPLAMTQLVAGAADHAGPAVRPGPRDGCAGSAAGAVRALGAGVGPGRVARRQAGNPHRRRCATGRRHQLAGGPCALGSGGRLGARDRRHARAYAGAACPPCGAGPAPVRGRAPGAAGTASCGSASAGQWHRPGRRMKRFLRGATILWVVFRFGLDGLVLDSFQKPGLRLLARMVSVGRRLDAPRGRRLRGALERLGPIFVKFGQVLSTRRDLLPADIADELARLQDRVAPFAPEIAIATIHRALHPPGDQDFGAFERVPVASASIAQVHFATLRDRQGIEREVAVKVLRPGMLAVIEKDLSLMRMMAGWVESLSADGKRLKPRQVVAEFDNYLHDELDLVREAANAAQLRRNMQGLDLVLIPEVFRDF